MSRYIDADKLRRELCNEYDHQITMSDNYQKASEVIARQPYADVAEIKHGKWIEDENENMVCSICKTGKPETDTIGTIHTLDKVYCYFCGAKMDLEELK